jgi:hypothetical protein
MENKVGFFEVSSGVRSAMRLIYIIGMLSTIVLTFGIIYLKAFQKLEITWTELGLYDTILFGIFTTNKLYQNAQENNDSSNITTGTTTSITTSNIEMRDVQDPNPPRPKS